MTESRYIAVTLTLELMRLAQCTTPHTWCRTYTDCLLACCGGGLNCMGAGLATGVRMDV